MSDHYVRGRLCHIKQTNLHGGAVRVGGTEVATRRTYPEQRQDALRRHVGEGTRVRLFGLQLQTSKKFLQEVHLHKNCAVEEKSKEIQGSDTGDCEASDIGDNGSVGGSCKPYYSRVEELFWKSRASSQDIL